MFKSFIVFILISSSCNVGWTKEFSIVGTWKMIVKESPMCVETHRYQKDGKLFVISGLEKTEQTYKAEVVPLEPGVLKITSTVKKDSGGKDCSGSEEDLTGKTDSDYAYFGQDGQTMRLCYPPLNKGICYGTFKKILVLK